MVHMLLDTRKQRNLLLSWCHLLVMVLEILQKSQKLTSVMS